MQVEYQFSMGPTHAIKVGNLVSHEKECMAKRRPEQDCWHFHNYDGMLQVWIGLHMPKL